MPKFRIDIPYGTHIQEWPHTVEWAATALDAVDGVDRVRFRALEQREQHALPHEAFLRLLPTTDPGDPESLVELCRQVGPLHMPDDLVQHAWAPDQLIPDLRKRSKRWESLGRNWSEDGGQYSIALDEVRTTATVLKTLVEHWTLHVKDDDPRKAWGQLAAGGYVDPTTAWTTFVFAINVLLRPFSPRITVVQEPPRRTWAFDGAAEAVLQPILANTLALHLYNAIIEEVEPRTCPECGTPFIRQEGRARHAQHRTTGVTYCSSRCARRKADREWKRKKRKQ